MKIQFLAHTLVSVALAVIATSAAYATTTVPANGSATFGISSVFQNNNTTALYVGTNATVLITGATFSGNSADSIDNFGTTTIDSATFSNNSGTLLVNESGATMDIYGGTFTGNSVNNLFNYGTINIYDSAITTEQILNTVGATTFHATLPDDPGVSVPFYYINQGSGVINLIPDAGMAAPEPSSLVTFAVFGVSIGGLLLAARRRAASHLV